MRRIPPPGAWKALRIVLARLIDMRVFADATVRTAMARSPLASRSRVNRVSGASPVESLAGIGACPTLGRGDIGGGRVQARSRGNRSASLERAAARRGRGAPRGPAGGRGAVVTRCTWLNIGRAYCGRRPGMVSNSAPDHLRYELAARIGWDLSLVPEIAARASGLAVNDSAKVERRIMRRLRRLDRTDRWPRGPGYASPSICRVECAR